MAKNKFFNEQSEPSKIKAKIVSTYLISWAKIIINAYKKYNSLKPAKIAYIDLFAGPGRYKDGAKSTPLMVLEKTINDPDLCNSLMTHFNDKNLNHSYSLKKAITKLPNIKNLKYEPKISYGEIGTNTIEMYENKQLIPSLFFIDPWGYKGLSLRLINSVLKDWGSDCLFFFNYNRINMGITNPHVKKHIDSIFGEDRANILRDKLVGLDSFQRESIILETLGQSIKSHNNLYHVLPFKFKDIKSIRTSHYLIFVSKDFKGYDVMKGIMARESSHHNQGVPSFEFNPAKQMLLFESSTSLVDLQKMILNDFAGRKISMFELCKNHSVGTPFIKKNYKDALIKLVETGKIHTDKYRKGTFADKKIAIIPKR